MKNPNIISREHLINLNVGKRFYQREQDEKRELAGTKKFKGNLLEKIKDRYKMLENEVVDEFNNLKNLVTFTNFFQTKYDKVIPELASQAVKKKIINN